MHYYITYFFQLLLGLETVPTYNYTAVYNWITNIDGALGVFDLHELYIPINKYRVHLLLLRVQMAEKPIELWDSLGHNETNQLYLQSAQHHLYNTHNAIK